jgi:hypothetical protein
LADFQYLQTIIRPLEVKAYGARVGKSETADDCLPSFDPDRGERVVDRNIVKDALNPHPLSDVRGYSSLALQVRFALTHGHQIIRGQFPADVDTLGARRWLSHRIRII